MRIALILLSVVALVFIGSISWSIVNQNSWVLFETKKAIDLSPSTSDTTSTLELETLRYQMKTDEKIEALNQKIEELSRKTGNLPTENLIITDTGSTKSGSTQSEKIVKISGKLLATLMPTITPTLVKNNGIFDLHIFNSATDFSTYEDVKFGIKIIPTTLTYDALLKNFRAINKEVYTINETSQFSVRSFYVNPPKPDTLVRLVMEYESQAIAIEVIKPKFPTFKLLISGTKEVIKAAPPRSTSSQIIPKPTTPTTPKTTPEKVILPVVTKSGTIKPAPTR